MQFPGSCVVPILVNAQNITFGFGYPVKLVSKSTTYQLSTIKHTFSVKGLTWNIAGALDGIDTLLTCALQLLKRLDLVPTSLYTVASQVGPPSTGWISFLSNIQGPCAKAHKVQVAAPRFKH